MGAHAPNALRRGDQVDYAHMPGSQLGQQIQGGHGAAPGGQHGFDQDYLKGFQVRRQALMVGSRPQCGLLPFQPDKAHARVRDELENRIQHPQPGPQNRHQHHLALQAMAGRPGQGRLDPERRDRE